MAATPIHQAIAELPDKNLTVRLLNVLDYITPGTFKNITSFEAMLKEVTGEDDQAYLQEIGEHAMALYADPAEGYQRALRIYSIVDSLDKVAGAASLASQVGERVNFLSFLTKLTPKDDTVQAIDAAAKLAAELAGFYYLNGMPGDTVADFARSFKNYAGSDAARVGAWIAVDGVMPLGPDFIDLIASKLSGTSESSLMQNKLFSKVSEFLPGDSLTQKKGMVMETLAATRGTISEWVSERGVSREGIAKKLESFVDMSDGKLDLVAAGLDVSTNYFEHTGTQSVARQLIDRAYGEV